MDMHLVCLVDEVPREVVDRLLATSHARMQDLAPGSPQTLTPVGPEICDPAALLGQTPDAVSRLLGPAHELFVILDARSVEDDTALLVARGSLLYDRGDDAVDSVRIAFTEAQCLVTSLEMRTSGFEELQSIANSQGGVYRPGPPPQRGGPAPRKPLSNSLE
ncbi:hypothetical protein QBC47DRAFT_363751 [Echria macrotheca]|uniref:Uncharacterized protein n=1 Tax=Echria macrotheca TaxID=438768 RepID=A0AAJ0B5P7_9PEZI|nr:hypothetical protein QBC47DRAFT_363751 [Echria macrotheca]